MSVTRFVAVCVLPSRAPFCSIFFFLNDPPTTEIYTLSLHDALPICPGRCRQNPGSRACPVHGPVFPCDPGEGCWSQSRNGACVLLHHNRRRWCPRRDCPAGRQDRKSTRLNSSHDQISYAVFCLKKKK